MVAVALRDAERAQPARSGRLARRRVVDDVERPAPLDGIAELAELLARRVRGHGREAPLEVDRELRALLAEEPVDGRRELVARLLDLLVAGRQRLERELEGERLAERERRGLLEVL